LDKRVKLIKEIFKTAETERSQMTTVGLIIQAGAVGIALFLALIILKLSRTYIKQARKHEEDYAKLSNRLFNDYAEVIKNNTEQYGELCKVMERFERSLSDLMMILVEIRNLIETKVKGNK